VTGLAALVAAELSEPVDPGVSRLAAAVAQRHGAAAQAVLFYGSCLRSGELAGQMLDFYLIVDDYRRAYGGRWLAIANRLLPPNVFPMEQDGLVAKYAVLSMADFRRLASSRTFNVSVWARFAQPSRLVWHRDAAAAAETAGAVAGAAPALLAAARPLATASADPLDLWRGAFALTYGAELRAERSGRATSIVDLDPDRYRRFTPAVLAALGGEGGNIRASTARRGWALRRVQGKMLSVLRLIKAGGTFAGGIDYLAWKINRHAGTRIEISDWQRRHPLLGAITLLPRLLRSGAVR
jgi:hypothetical protein